VKAFVINLPHATERRAHIERELAAQGLEHEFIEAVDGAALTSAEREELIDEAAVARHPDWLTPGMVGNALSHLRAWEAVARSGDACGLVLEDDAALSPRFAELLAAVERNIADGDVVLLTYRAFGRCRLSTAGARDLTDGRRLVTPVDPRGMVAAAAYVVSPGACRAMADFLLPVSIATDKWSEFVGAGAISSLRCVYPRAVSIRTDFASSVSPAWTGKGRVPVPRGIKNLGRAVLYRRMSRFVLTSDPPLDLVDG
jgi:glycosyl transferase family 25